MNPTYDFRGQVALVTGAGGGMGLDTARAFAAGGAAVVLADVDEQALRAATDELSAQGHRALGVACDVADEDQAAALVDRTVGELGRLDMAFNNAGIMLPLADAAEEPAESFDRVTAINMRGVWACMKHELRQMRGQGSGAIVNCSSLGGLVGNPGTRVLPRHQARRARPHQERGAGLRAARDPHQRRLPRHDRDADGRRHDGQRRAHGRRRRRGSTDRPRRPRRRDRGRRAVAVQPRRQPRGRRRASRRRRLHRPLTPAALAAANYRVALVARRADRIQALAEEFRDGAIAIQADVTDRDSIVAAAQRGQDELGGADVLVNNAGVMLLGPFVSDQRARRMLGSMAFAGLSRTMASETPRFTRQRSLVRNQPRPSNVATSTHD
jgi:NAD(P)-dependent dehydrogenase (short-subunit alcohol dehydrogenase family)